MAREIVNRQLNVYIQSGQAQKVYDELIKKEKQFNEELKQADLHPKRIKAIEAELKKLEEPISKATKKLKGELNPTFRDLQQSASRLLAEFKRTGDPAALKGYAQINGELQNMKAHIKGVENAQKDMGKTGFFSAAFWANLAANGVMMAGRAIQSFLSGVIDEALNADEATRRLESTLDNLGRTDSFDRITRKAQDLADQFRYLDNDDIVAVFNKLIDYGKLTEKEMNNLLPVIIDFAAKSKISIEESASVIIKALEGNAKGLKEYGINVKDAKTETERLGIIMTTLKGKVDGAGEAFQNSAKGGIATARQEMNNLKEDIGTFIIPALNKLLSLVVTVLKGVKQLYNDIKSVFTGSNRFEDIDAEVRYETAKKNIEEFKKKIAGLSDALQLQNLQKQLDYYNSVVQQEQAALLQSKFDGNHDKVKDKINDNILLFQQIAKMYGDEVALLKSVDSLGIKNNDTKTATTVKVKELKQSLDVLAESWKRLYDTQNKGRSVTEKALQDQQKLMEETQKVFTEALKAYDFYYKEEAKKKKPADGIAGNDPNSRIQQFDRNKLAGLELNVMQQRGKQRLQAELALLKEQERQELQAKELTENEKLLIEEKYRQARMKAETDHFINQVNQVASYVKQTLDIMAVFSQAKTNNENIELERDRQINDKKKRNLESRLRAGKISQQQYDQELLKLQREQEKREKEIAIKQFKRQQRADMVQALINGALAITSTLAAKPGPTDIVSFGILRAVQIGLAIATTAAQVATIASQKPPQLARGGQLGGNYHSDGGNPILDGRTGRKIAEIERGEGIINRHSMADGNRYTVTGTTSQIASKLNAIGGGVNWQPGARLVPAWSIRKPIPMNFAQIKRYYAEGGKFQSPAVANNNDAAQPATDPMLLQILDRLDFTLSYIEKNGIMAYSIITETEKTQARLDAIRDDATMKG